MNRLPLAVVSNPFIRQAAEVEVQYTRWRNSMRAVGFSFDDISFIIENVDESNIRADFPMMAAVGQIVGLDLIGLTWQFPHLADSIKELDTSNAKEFILGFCKLLHTHRGAENNV